MTIDGCFTGQGATLDSTLAALKFTGDAANDYAISSISGLARSVIVIDDSDLGIPVNAAMQYCAGDLVSLGKLTVEVKLHMDNTTRFSATADGNLAVSQAQPIPLGVATGTTTTSTFVLEFPTTNVTNGTRLNFSGFFSDDSGIALTSTDRIRSTW